MAEGPGHVHLGDLRSESSRRVHFGIRRRPATISYDRWSERKRGGTGHPRTSSAITGLRTYLAKVDVAGSIPVSRSTSEARRDAGSAVLGLPDSRIPEPLRVHGRVHGGSPQRPAGSSPVGPANPRQPSQPPDGLPAFLRRVFRHLGISPRVSHRWTSVDVGSRPEHGQRHVQPAWARR